MASRRALKKNVNYIVGELFTECLVHLMYIPGTDKAKADELLGKILVMQNEFIGRIDHSKTDHAKEYYRKFRKDFQSQVDAIVDEITKLG